MKGLPFLVVLEMGGLFLYSTSLYCCVSSHGINELHQRFRAVKGIQKCQSFDIVRFERWCATAARHRDVVYVCLRRRNPACRVQQFVLPLAPLTQTGRVDGIAAQVQEYLGSLVEAFTGKFS